MVENHRNLGRKAMQLCDPIVHGGEWRHNKVRSSHLHLIEMGKKSNDLHGLAKTHLISKDPVESILKQSLFRALRREGMSHKKSGSRRVEVEKNEYFACPHFEAIAIATGERERERR